METTVLGPTLLVYTAIPVLCQSVPCKESINKGLEFTLNKRF